MKKIGKNSFQYHQTLLKLTPDGDLFFRHNHTENQSFATTTNPIKPLPHFGKYPLSFYLQLKNNTRIEKLLGNYSSLFKPAKYLYVRGNNSYINMSVSFEDTNDNALKQIINAYIQNFQSKNFQLPF